MARAPLEGYQRIRLAAIRRWLIERQELGLLVAVLAIAGTLWAFIEIADEVMEQDVRRFDRGVLLALREPGNLSDPLGPLWVEEAARDVTALGGVAVLVLVTASVIGFLMLLRDRLTAVTVAVAVGGGILLSSALKLAFARTRPELVPHLVEVYTASFPSGHATMSAVVYLTLGALLAQVQSRYRIRIYVLAVAMLVTVLVGVSRVYLGVHWPTDVLAGWSVGVAWASSCWLAAYWFRRRVHAKARP